MTAGFITLQHDDGYDAIARWWAADARPLIPGPRPPIPNPEAPPAAISSNKPDSTPPAHRVRTAAVLYLHGIQSHGEWFEHSASRLAEAGFNVMMPDRRGSGRNARDRGHADSADRLLTDAGQWLDELRRRTGEQSVHVVGVSWGGKLALNLLHLRPRHVASLALVAPGLFPIVDIPTAEKLRVAWSALANARHLFDIPINEPEMFTANPQWLEYLRRDPLRLRQVTASFLIASRRLDRFTRSAHRHAGVPIAVFLAEHDRIIDNEKTRRWLRDLSWPQRQLIEYRNAHHTLEFEPAGCTFLDDLVNWARSQEAGQA